MFKRLHLREQWTAGRFIDETKCVSLKSRLHCDPHRRDPELAIILGTDFLFVQTGKPFGLHFGSFASNGIMNAPGFLQMWISSRSVRPPSTTWKRPKWAVFLSLLLSHNSRPALSSPGADDLLIKIRLRPWKNVKAPDLAGSVTRDRICHTDNSLSLEFRDLVQAHA